MVLLGRKEIVIMVQVIAQVTYLTRNILESRTHFLFQCGLVLTDPCNRCVGLLFMFIVMTSNARHATSTWLDKALDLHREPTTSLHRFPTIVNYKYTRLMTTSIELITNIS